MLSFSLAPLPPSLQKLTPAQARFCLDIQSFTEKELGVPLAGQRLLAGFSGGADSTALLLALHYLSQKAGFSLFAAHLDHQLRPSSGMEAARCGAFCDALGVRLITRRADPASLRVRGHGIEEAAREARYAFYAETAALEQCDWVVTGHTANDLAEDILMRLIRGTGWPGLSGMEAQDGTRRLLRPLLLTSRSRIEAFLNGLGITWIEDESNTDPAYFRNRVRMRLLPLILEENPAFLDKAAGLWRLGRLDTRWIDSMLPDLSSNEEQQRSSPREHVFPQPPSFLPREQLEGMPKALRLRLYKKILAALGPGQARLDALLALDASFEVGGEKTEHQFPGGKLALVDKRGIRWQPGSAASRSAL